MADRLFSAQSVGKIPLTCILQCNSCSLSLYKLHFDCKLSGMHCLSWSLSLWILFAAFSTYFLEASAVPSLHRLRSHCNCDILSLCIQNELNWIEYRGSEIETLRLRFFVISREPRTSRSHVSRALPSGSRFEVHVCTARPRSRGKWFTARFFAP